MFTTCAGAFAHSSSCTTVMSAVVFLLAIDGIQVPLLRGSLGVNAAFSRLLQ